MIIQEVHLVQDVQEKHTRRKQRTLKSKPSSIDDQQAIDQSKNQDTAGDLAKLEMIDNLKST